MRLFYKNIETAEIGFEAAKTQTNSYMSVYLDYKDITKSTEKLDLRAAILRDLQILESYQMFSDIDIACRIVPEFVQPSFCDYEAFTILLLKYATPITLQYVRYQIKIQHYKLIER